MPSGAGGGDEMVPVLRGGLATRDMDVLSEVVAGAYYEHAPRLRCPDPGLVRGEVQMASAWPVSVGTVSVYGLWYETELESPDPPTMVFVTGGRAAISNACEDLRLSAGDVFRVPEGRTDSGMGDTSYITLSLPTAIASELAEQLTGLPADELRFESMAPVTAAAQRMFAATARFVHDQLLVPGADQVHPLIARELTRVIAAAMLETFPNTTMTADYLPGPRWVASAAVRRAAAFIDAHADEPVTLAEIAGAAGVSSRAVQAGFRRHLGITPSGYLRRVRLEGAHADLTAATLTSGITVQAVARRWGWLSPAQFAAAYRQRFGIPPSQTLRT
jgi:AraC-like DNA-binding protein